MSKVVRMTVTTVSGSDKTLPQLKGQFFVVRVFLERNDIKHYLVSYVSVKTGTVSNPSPLKWFLNVQGTDPTESSSLQEGTLDGSYRYPSGV